MAETEYLLAGSLFSTRRAAADTFAARAMPIVESLPPRSHILDLGCGSGELVGRILAVHPTMDCVGVDISLPSIAVAKMQGIGRFEVADFMAWSGETFDLIVSDGALHLLACRDDALCAKLSSHLKAGGRLAVSMPSNIWTNRLLSFSRSLWRMSPLWCDGVAARIAAAVFPREDRNLLAQRIAYLRIPPARLLDGAFITAMARHGIQLNHVEPMKESIPFKLQFQFSLWTKN